MITRPVAILVTGSRNWNDEQKVREVLERFKGRDVMVIHGAALGADDIADNEAGRLGYWTEHYPADWNKHGRKAGPIRNAAMVERLIELATRGDECHVFAFPLPDSRGTWDCVNRAKAAGFRVEVIR